MIIEPSDFDILAVLWSLVPGDQRQTVIREWISSGRPDADDGELAVLLVEVKRIGDEPSNDV